MRNARAISVAALIAVTALTLISTGCQTAEPTDTPGVERLGEWVLRYSGEDLVMVVSYRYAAKHPGDEWLILDVAASAPYGRQTVIQRSGVFVESPEGDRIALATQSDFGAEYGAVMAKAARSEVVTDPLDYFPHSRRDCRFDFFVQPGESITYDSVSVDDIRACRGKLFFQAPGGVAVGTWTLVVELDNSTARVPFPV